MGIARIAADSLARTLQGPTRAYNPPMVANRIADDDIRYEFAGRPEAELIDLSGDGLFIDPGNRFWQVQEWFLKTR